MKIIKKLSALALALCMLLSLVPITASAGIMLPLPTPTNLKWNDTLESGRIYATWNTSGEEVWCIATLYKDGTMVKDLAYAPYGTNKYDFTSYMQEPGNYTFTVQAIALAEGSMYYDSEITKPSAVYTVNAQTQKYIYGDVDKSNDVTVKDATLVQKYCALVSELDDTQMKIADVNGDNKVTISDATYIQKYLASVVSAENRTGKEFTA